MALIQCPECGKQISSLAQSCPNCGCPIEAIAKDGIVKIKLPNIELGTVGLFASRRSAVQTTTGKVLWEGQHGQTAIFKVDGATKIIIDLGTWANPIEGTVYPRKKYSCIQDMGMHWKATYRITEVDVIDSD